MTDSDSQAHTQNPILWGAYLACSWTWCIGMFLPALLLRDMGWAGFWIFAVPNVVGAAVMGWILQSRVDSIRFVEKHPEAIWWFSVITLAFHMFWLLWILNFIRAAFQIPVPYFAGAAGICSAFVFLVGKSIRRERTPQLALILLIVSLGVLVGTFVTPDVQESNRSLLAAAPRSLAPLWMLPVMVFGFMLCPYLDITFHHARQQLDTRRNGRLGFTLGFVGFFAVMILLTTRYAGVIAGALDGSLQTPITTPWLAVGILVHLLCQWLFTVRMHLDRIRTLPRSGSKQSMLLAVVVLSGAAGYFAIKLPDYAGLSAGEVIYRCFMGAYGLVFPAYMLYRVGLRRNAASERMTMWIAIALAFPLFWLGFIERETLWLVPGLGIVLLGAIKRRIAPSK